MNPELGSKPLANQLSTSLFFKVLSNHWKDHEVLGASVRHGIESGLVGCAGIPEVGGAAGGPGLAADGVPDIG